MKTINDGGPAFPDVAVFNPNSGDFDSSSSWTGNYGLSLRDYFAAEAMKKAWDDYSQGTNGDSWRQLISARAYAVADAMIAEREK